MPHLGDKSSIMLRSDEVKLDADVGDEIEVAIKGRVVEKSEEQEMDFSGDGPPKPKGDKYIRYRIEISKAKKDPFFEKDDRVGELATK